MSESATGQRLLGVGVATLDIVNEVAAYPAEDGEIRASTQERRLGGNAANSLTVLRQLGHACSWCGTLADDDRSAEILAALHAQGIDTLPAVRHAGACTPTSYITLSRDTGSRTIVHYRDLPELSAEELARLSLDDFDWVHFEGRDALQTAAMLRDCAERRPDLPISLEVEKPRPGIERLLRGPHLLIFSRAYALSCGYHDPEAFLASRWEQTDADLLLLPWGAKGAYGQARGEPPCFAPPHSPVQVLDTLGAGDVFNAAVIDGMLAGMDLPSLLQQATRLAGHKCGRRGLDGLVDSAREIGLL